MKRIWCWIGILCICAGCAIATPPQGELRASLQALLTHRAQLLQQGDVDEFVATVDPQDALLRQEERSLAISAQGQEVQCTMELIAVELQGEAALGRVVQTLQCAGETRSAEYVARFCAVEGNWHFAGYSAGRLTQRTPAGMLQVWYPVGMEKKAAEVLVCLESVVREYAQLTAREANGVRVTLYHDPQVFAQSVQVDLPTWVGGWYEAGESVRLCLPAHSAAATVLPILRHELCHCYVDALSGGNAAYWLQEGLAMVAEQMGVAGLQQKHLPQAAAYTYAQLCALDLETLSDAEAADYYAAAQSYAMALCSEKGYAWVQTLLESLGELPRQTGSAAARRTQSNADTDEALRAMGVTDMDALLQAQLLQPHS